MASEPSTDQLKRELRDAALKLLGRRDHSSKELTDKLAQRGFDGQLIEHVLAELSQSGLHSEQRYAESYARQRAMKAYGPLRIQAELAQRGLSREQISEALNALDIDFAEQARSFYLRKYRQPISDYGEKVRRNQAMARRGFTGEHLRGLLD
ncbi:MAG: regulatory protein RecX [Pseudomonadota bacterium]